MIFNSTGKIAAFTGSNGLGFVTLRYLAQFLKRVLVAAGDTGWEWRLNFTLKGCLPERLLS